MIAPPLPRIASDPQWTAFDSLERAMGGPVVCVSGALVVQLPTGAAEYWIEVPAPPTEGECVYHYGRWYVPTPPLPEVAPPAPPLPEPVAPLAPPPAPFPRRPARRQPEPLLPRASWDPVEPTCSLAGADPPVRLPALVPFWAMTDCGAGVHPHLTHAEAWQLGLVRYNARRRRAAQIGATARAVLRVLRRIAERQS